MVDFSESKSRTTDGRFAKGNPGGPGRPRKVVRAAADALDERVAAKADDLFDVAVRRAEEGNDGPLKMLLDRVWPIGRNRPLEVSLPKIADAGDMLEVSAVVTNAVFAGEATPQEAAALNEMMKAHLYSGGYAELAGCVAQSDAKKPKREHEEEAEE